MAKKVIPLDSTFIQESYDGRLLEINELIANNRAVQAYNELSEMMEVYRHFRNVDSLKTSRKVLKRGAAYKSQKRSLNSWLFKESLIKDDFDYYLEEDIYDGSGK